MKKNKTQMIYFLSIFKVSRIRCPDSTVMRPMELGAIIKARNTARCLALGLGGDSKCRILRAVRFLPMPSTQMAISSGRITI